MKRSLLALGLLAALAVSVSAKTKIGFIYSGARNDPGWNLAQDEGRIYVEKTFPDVETVPVENVPENADAERVMERMARAGVQIIFATSYGYFDQAVRVGKKFPDLHFLLSSEGQTAHNLGNYYGSTEEAMYLAGLAAGASSKSGKLGYVAAMPIPLQVRGVNAFTLGARSVNPKATVQVIFLGTWKDAAKESEAANTLIAQGVDVLASELDSPINVIQLAEKRGIPCVGQYYSDAKKFAPTQWLIGNYYNWGPIMAEQVKGIFDKTWKEGKFIVKLANGGIVMTPPGPSASPAAKALVETQQAEIISGKRKLWSGPVKKQDGTIGIEAGKVLTSDESEAMNFLVEGVIGHL
jgi:basic membrane lipoprotein Med (substrate-binding protein (PBP1-ABC) superfamily)